MQKNYIKITLLLVSMYGISYGMNPQIISAISEQAQPTKSSSLSTLSQIFSYLPSFSAPSACDYPHTSSQARWTYSGSDSAHLQQSCTIERLSNHINDKFLQVSSDSYLYYFKVLDATIQRLKKTRILFDDKVVMEELNNIEEYCNPLLRQNGYVTWNNELIGGLEEENSYFNSLIHKIILTQTSWENLKASNIDTFFKWSGKPLKKSKIGMYIHLEVMKRYAARFNIKHYTEVKLMRHMLYLVLSNLKDDVSELELLLTTKSFYTLKDNQAIQQAALSRIQELKKKSHQEL